VYGVYDACAWWKLPAVKFGGGSFEERLGGMEKEMVCKVAKAAEVVYGEWK
jgi:hypothetical protein